jgi:hypothetical protein
MQVKPACPSPFSSQTTVFRSFRASKRNVLKRKVSYSFSFGKRAQTRQQSPARPEAVSLTGLFGLAKG